MERSPWEYLTSDAGIWATSGIGLAIGAGMYWLGISATILTLIGLEAVSYTHLDVYKRQDYNRVVKDLNGLSPEQFLTAVSKNFVVEEKGTEVYRPQSVSYTHL